MVSKIKVECTLLQNIISTKNLKETFKFDEVNSIYLSKIKDKGINNSKLLLVLKYICKYPLKMNIEVDKSILIVQDKGYLEYLTYGELLKNLENS